MYQSSSDEKIWPVVLAVFGLFLAVLLFFFGIFYLWNRQQVGPGERAVVLKWGKVQQEIRDPGIYFVNPLLGANELKIINVRSVRDDIVANAATKDLQELNITVAVNWRVDPASVMDFYLAYRANDRAKDVKLVPLVQEAVKSFSATYNAEELITKRQEFKTKIEEKMKKDLGSVLITIDSVSITNVEFSANFSAAIEQKQVAEQNAKKAEYVAKQAEQEAQAAINRAKGEAEAQKLQAQVLDDKILFKLWIDKWNGVMPVYSAETMPVPFKQVN